MVERRIAMRELVGPELLDHALQVGFIVTEMLGLLAIVRVDHFFDRNRACHRHTRPHPRGPRAERISGDMPERRERGRADTTVGDKRVESREMFLLLRRHFLHRVAGRARRENGQLAFVNPNGTELARMIDTDHRVDRRCRVARQISRAGPLVRAAHSAARPCRHARYKPPTPAAIEIRAL